MIVATDEKNLVKDLESKAVLNTDLASFEKYKTMRERNEEIRRLRSLVDDMQKEKVETDARLNALHNEMEFLRNAVSKLMGS